MMNTCTTAPCFSFIAVVYYSNTKDRTMAESANLQRKIMLERAKVAEQAERYEDMVKCMKELVETGGKLSAEERNLLSVAYKNVVGSRRSALRVAMSICQKATAGKIEQAERVQMKIETEFKEMCGDVLSLLDKFLIPGVDELEAEVFYHKMMADYYGYLTEILEGSEREDMVTKANESYEKAYDKATTELAPAHPVRLGAALSFSVFHYEIRHDPKEACRVAKEAFDAALELIDGLKDEAYKDSSLIMQLLRDNLTVWTSEEEDQGEFASVVYHCDTKHWTRDNRESKVYRAKVWEQAEQYDTMAKCMKELVEIPIKMLWTEERNLLSVAYKNVVGSRRSAWRIVTSMDQKKADQGLEESDIGRQAARWLQEKVETEMKEVCGEILALLEDILIPGVDMDGSLESQVFYLKMKGDYLRYLTEISEGSEKEDLMKKANDSYKKAYEKAPTELGPTHPVRLGVALNFSVFHYEIRNDGEEACRVAKEAFDDAISSLDEVQEDSYKDSTLIMQLLRENFTLWSSEQEDHGDN
ncbi:YWHAZ [Branchiostoma lanceolatum]|uniref:YWHAZ protein n=1 Tax=Branchiostoma lanceolatum TaxID=7740 RepID=A0A8K0A9C3_BRALA|nr:YWHAZ [Branchiostoma lanceolatum]